MIKFNEEEFTEVLDRWDKCNQAVEELEKNQTYL